MAALDPNSSVEISNSSKIAIGVLGGIAAAATKYLGQDHDRIFKASGVDSANLTDALIGYCVLGLILAFIGGLCAWASNENHRLKLLAIAVSAPAMITTFFGGDSEGNTRPAAMPSATVSYYQFEWPNFIGSAVAAENLPEDLEPPRGQRSTLQALKDGLRFVFRIGEPRYWIIVGSFQDKSKANAFVEKINNADPNLGAFVGLRSSTDYYPVIVGHYATSAEATEILERANQLDFVKEREPFLSPG